MSNDILKYIYKRLSDIKNNEINLNLHQSKCLEKKLDMYVDNVMEKYPSLVGCAISKGQIGGQILDQKTKQKLSKISAVFSAYNSLKIDKILERSREIETNLDKIISKISSIDDPDKINATQINESILNNLDTIRIDADKFAKGVDINIEKSKLYVKPTNPIDMTKKMTTVKSEYIELKTQLDYFEEQLKQSVEPEEQALSNTREKILTLNKEILKTIGEIDEILTHVIEANEQIDMLIKYTAEDTISVIITIDDLIKTIKTVKITEQDQQQQVHQLFLANINAQLENFMKKEIKERDFITFYNENIPESFAYTYKLPLKYFDGKFTQRISNNFLLREHNIDQKLEVLNTMLNSNTDSSSLTSFVHILSPDFVTLKEKSSVTTEDDILVGPRIMNGGTTSFGNVYNSFTELIKNIELFYVKSDKYKKHIKSYNVKQLQVLAHTLFQTLIVTNQLFEEDHVVYNYINIGTLTFYQRIITNILDKIHRKNKSDKILYFKKYHYMTLQKLSSFINVLVDNIEPNQIIDIRESKGEATNRFLLLNYFKDILESYNETDMNAITIYARINDIRTPIKIDKSTDANYIKYLKQKMFLSDYDRKDLISYEKFNNIVLEGKVQSNLEYIQSNNLNTNLMYVSKKSCDALNTENKYPMLEPLNQYKFTEVFDSIKFPDNGAISKYMTLDTQIAKGKGVALMTYGYSGTGKTYTLFGNASEGKQGMLQSTLDNITGLKWVKFRLFEIHGYGVPYPHYWTNETDDSPRINDIEHNIYAYNLELSADTLKFNGVSPTEKISSPDIVEYINKHNDAIECDTHECTDSSYTFIAGNIVSTIFSNFDTFMETVETERISKKRIRDTPNNTVSSRSVLVYDFIIRVGKKNVPFLILDLPGREEIAESYVNPFLSNEIILDLLGLEKEGTETLKLKMMLMSMAINPIAVPIFSPTIVFDFINNMEQTERTEIFNKELDMKYEFVQNANFENTQNYNITLPDERGKSYITGIVDGERIRGFKYHEECINSHGRQILNPINVNKYDGTLSINKFRGYHYYKSTKCNLQYKALAGIHFINRLILLKKFEVLELLFKQIVDKTINTKLIESIESKSPDKILELYEKLEISGFKGELLHKTVSKTMENLKKLVVYDYYLVPAEGIYINENIAGLIKFLASNELMIPDEIARNKFIEKLKKDMMQPQGLNFQYQQKVARVWLSSMNEQEEESPRSFYLFGDNEVPEMLVNGCNGDMLEYNESSMKSNLKKIETSYESKKIFSFKEPLITNILSPYIKEIFDYKVFYLFGNYAGGGEALRELKCEHQYLLLENTSDFIDVVVNPGM